MRHHPKNVLTYVPIMILLIIITFAEGKTQESQRVTFPSVGTLNLLLANKNGFVIAADSRRTDVNSRRYWDDSHKLFRIGPKSAMVIAGFASWIAQGSPLDLQAASVLREDLSADEWVSGKRALTELPSFINGGLGFQLGLYGALLATDKPATPANSLDFQTLAAEITDSGKVQIVQSRFKPKIELVGPFDLPIPSYEIASSGIVADHFVVRSAGQDSVARAILDGIFPTRDPRILTYYRARLAGQLDELPLLHLEQLATAILGETSRATIFVGGPDQIGVFSIDGTVKWTQPRLATDRQKLHSTILKIGFAYTPDGLTPQEYAAGRGKKVLANMRLSLLQAFEQPLTQVFVGNQFRDVTVYVDGNVFAGNEFAQVRFKYEGGPFYFANNAFNECIVEILVDIPVPPQLMRCKLQRHRASEVRRIIGSPIRPQPKGCIKRDASGRVVIKTEGWEGGQDCKGSALIVPKILP